MFVKLQVYPAEQDCASPAGQPPNVMQFSEKRVDVNPSKVDPRLLGQSDNT